MIVFLTPGRGWFEIESGQLEQRTPTGVDGQIAVAVGPVKVGAAMGTEAQAVLVAKGLHRRGHGRVLSDDGSQVENVVVVYQAYV